MQRLFDWFRSRCFKPPTKRDFEKYSKEVDNIFLGYTSIMNLMGKHSQLNTLFYIDNANIIYLPEVYVNALRNQIIEMYKKSDDPITSGIISKGNLSFTMEYVTTMYNEIADKKEKIIKKAAFIMYNLISKHPFADGNKRTGLITCNSFLEYNGYSISTLPFRDSHDFIINVAKGEKGEIDCQEFIKKYNTDLVITPELEKSLEDGLKSIKTQLVKK